MAIYENIIKPLYSLTNRRKIDEEMFEDADIWCDALIGIVPVNRLQQCWRRACRQQPGSFAPNFFDVKNKWFEIEAEEKRAAERKSGNNPVLNCTHVALHKNADGTPNPESGAIFAMNPHTDEDELMPCAHCRPKDLSKFRADQIARYGEIRSPHITPEKAVESILRPAEVYLSLQEAKEISDAYYALVEKLVEDEKSRQELFVVFDEGANVFKYPHRADIVFSPEVMRSKIAQYQKALEKREK